MDLAGPVKPSSLGGASYFLGILDVYTRFSWVFTIRKKSDAAAKILEWKGVAEGQSHTKLQRLRTDNGGEFTSAAFRTSMALIGVELQTTPPRSPESNGMAERWNRTVQDKTRTIMSAALLPGYLWAEVLQATNMLRNMSPVSNLSCTPWEKWTGAKPDISKLRVLGSKAFCQIEKSARGGKFMPVSYKGVLVNYSPSSPAYRVWDYARQKVYNVAAPSFDEEAAPGWWRTPLYAATGAGANDDEPLVFPPAPPPPAGPADSQSEVIDGPPADGAPPDDASSQPPAAAVGAAAPAPAPSAVPADPDADVPAATVQPLPAPIPAPSQVPELRRSNRENRGVPPAHMADMLMVASLKGGEACTGTAEAAADAGVAAAADAAAVPAPAPAGPAAPQPLPTPIPAPPQVLGPRRSSQENRGVPPARMADMLMAATMEGSDEDPKTYKKAMLLPDAAHWVEACAAEVASLVENGVYEVVDRPAGKPVITSKWVFKKKRGLSGRVEKYKARLVARGFM